MSVTKLKPIKSKRIGTPINKIAPLPIKDTTSGYIFGGYFTGMSVDVICEQSVVHILHEHGCFGIGTETDSRLTKHPHAGLAVEENVLHLFLEEAFFLHYILKCLRIMDLDDNELTTMDVLSKFFDVEKDFFVKFVSYVFLRSRNWTVKSGLKFGGDFLLYKIGPRYYHASFVVLVSDSTKRKHLQTHCVHGHNRISESSKKDLLLLDVSYPANLVPLSPHTIDLESDLRKFHIIHSTIQRFNH